MTGQRLSRGGNYIERGLPAPTETRKSQKNILLYGLGMMTQ